MTPSTILRCEATECSQGARHPCNRHTNPAIPANIKKSIVAWVTGTTLGSLCQNEVHRSLSGNVLGAVVAQGQRIDVGEKGFARA